MSISCLDHIGRRAAELSCLDHIVLRREYPNRSHAKLHVLHVVCACFVIFDEKKGLRGSSKMIYVFTCVAIYIEKQIYIQIYIYIYIFVFKQNPWGVGTPMILSGDRGAYKL